MGDLSLLWLFLSQFVSVFVMVMNSKLLRDDKWLLAMINSYLITLSQLVFVWIVANGDFSMAMLFFIGGTGGSIGCGLSHFVYTRWLIKRR